jgi:hypothetical protein
MPPNLEELAAETVRAIEQHVPWGDPAGFVLEAIEIVRIDSTGAITPGVMLLWDQPAGPGQSRLFGILRSIEDLIEETRVLADPLTHWMWTNDLILALEEPHGGPTDGPRTWFRSWP